MPRSGKQPTSNSELPTTASDRHPNLTLSGQRASDNNSVSTMTWLSGLLMMALLVLVVYALLRQSNSDDSEETTDERHRRAFDLMADGIKRFCDLNPAGALRDQCQIYYKHGVEVFDQNVEANAGDFPNFVEMVNDASPCANLTLANATRGDCYWVQTIGAAFRQGNWLAENNHSSDNGHGRVVGGVIGGLLAGASATAGTMWCYQRRSRRGDYQQMNRPAGSVNNDRSALIGDAETNAARPARRQNTPM